jgi:hypothetical protein
LALGGLGVVLGKGRGNEGRDYPPAVPAGMGQGVAGEVHAAALPGGMEELGDGAFEPVVGIRDH